ncbi:unnamed protein product [Caenorhabditis angaria]|uniref:HMGCR/SNAP/NPC1-like sterol-sensing domain-containing protein n=1 Tax=Caenorhabditis angaria TaxID=860376 RepID=A0A9P1IG88_9PELO|nr:unnamed protein product [Caenorhabditis angaria]
MRSLNFQSIVTQFFEYESTVVVRWPLPFVVLPPVFTILMVTLTITNFTHLNITNDTLQVFLPDDMQSLRDLKQLIYLFPPRDPQRDTYSIFGAKFVYTVIEARNEQGNILESEGIRKMVELHRFVMAITTASGIKFSEICLKTDENSCTLHPISLALEDSEPELSIQFLLRYPSLKFGDEFSIDNAMVFGGVETIPKSQDFDGNSAIQKAKAVRLTYILESSKAADLWIDAFLREIGKFEGKNNNETTILWSSSKSLAKEMERNGELLIPWMPWTSLVLIIFCMFACSSPKSLVKSQPFIGFFAMFNATMATIASTSLLIYLQYPFLPLVFIMPFLVVSHKVFIVAKMTDWNVPDLLNCIKLVLNDGIILQPPQEDLKKYEKSEDLEDFVQDLFKKSERVGEFYDNIDTFRKDLEKAWDMPEYYRYGYDRPGTEFAKSFRAGQTVYKDEKGIEYLSKHDMILEFYDIFKDIPMHEMASASFLHWFYYLIPQQYHELENSYELVPYSIGSSMRKAAEEMDSVQPFKGVIREKNMFELRKYFDEDDEDFLIDQVQKLLDQHPISSEEYQEIYKKIHGEIRGNIEKAMDVQDNFRFAMEPSRDPFPIVRCFTSKISEKPMKFYFEKEVFSAIKSLRQDVRDKFEFNAETREERNLGIVNVITEQNFIEILEKYKVSMDDLAIIRMGCKSFSTMIVQPIISNYGTFCKLAADAFLQVVRYMIRNLELFTNIDENEFANLIMWIETNLADFFGKSGKICAIEMWKIEEMIEKANRELKLKKSSIHKLPLKESYEKSEILDFVQKSFQPLNLDLEVFKFHYTKIIDKRIPKRSDAYKLLSTCIEHKIIDSLKDLRVAFDQQSGNGKNEVDSNKMMKELEIDKKMEEVVEKVKEIANYTLAHFEVGKTQPISKFEKLLEIPNFRETFDDNSWKYLKAIFQDFEKTKQLLKNFEHLYDFEEKNGELLFSKKEKYIGDLESIRLMEMQEMERINRKRKLSEKEELEQNPEKLRDENKKLRRIVDELQGQLEDERKRFEEMVQKIKEENQKNEQTTPSG